MEQFTDIGDILAGKCRDKTVRIRGWLHNIRTGGGIQFLLIRDRTGVLQSTICKLKHIRDAMPFPRLVNRIYP